MPGRLGSAEQSKALPHTAWERRYARHDGMTADVLGLGVYRKAVFNGVRVARVSCMRRACAQNAKVYLFIIHVLLLLRLLSRLHFRLPFAFFLIEN